jgi:hypothetical protein
MRLELKRTDFTDKSTIGELSIDGEFFCYTLEDVVREEKIFGETAIPAGTYKIEITFSPHFQRDLPHLIDVPNYEGVRIHPGNKAADTEGCILVGSTKSTDFIGNSRVTFELLYEKLKPEKDLEISIV